MQLKDVFLAKLDMLSASFLYPVAFGLFDAYDPTQDMSVLPLTSHAGSRISGCSSLNHTLCLRPPIRQDPRAGEAFRCKDPASISLAERNTDEPKSYDKALAEAWKCCKHPTISDFSGAPFMNECPRYGANRCESSSCWQTSGGCDCSGRKWLSLTASSVFVTGMDDTTAEAKDKMKIYDTCRCFDSDLNVTSFMDALVDSAWLNNPAGIQVYVGISNDNTGPGMFRAFPGSVREKLPQAFENKGTEGRLYNVGVRPWFESAKASISRSGVSTFVGGRLDQLQAKRPPLTLTAPYKDADGKGDLVTLAAPIMVYDHGLCEACPPNFTSVAGGQCLCKADFYANAGFTNSSHSFSMGANDTRAVRDNQVGIVNLDADYDIDFILTINSNNSALTNVLRITSTDGNYGKYGDRLIAVYIKPSASELHICTDTTVSARALSCHGTPALPLGTPQHVRVKVEGPRKMVDIEGKRVVDVNDLGPRQRQMSTRIFISDRHEAAADARVSQLRVFSGCKQLSDYSCTGSVSTPPSTAFKGVVGLDLVVEELRALVNSIHLRETGEAIIFHKRSRLVLASPQLPTRSTIAGVLPKIDDLAWLSGHAKKFDDLEDSDFPCASHTAGLPVSVGSEDDQVVMVSGNVWQGEYCAVLVTRVQEIEWPIVALLENIDKQAMALFLSPSLIAAVCGVTLLAIVVLLAQRISRPLESTARDSKEIVKNIGGDLSKGEHSGGEDDVVKKRAICLGSQGEVGEIADLRVRFDNLLFDLLQKRQKSVGHQNPFARGSANEELKATVFQQGVRQLPQGEKLPALSPNDVAINILGDTVPGDPIRPAFKTRATRWNVVAMQLRLWLILPLTIGLLVIVASSAFALSQRTATWVAPVQAKMIEEEIRSLDLRVQQRAAALSETLVAGTNTINMVKHYWLRLLDGQLTWRSPDDVEPLLRRPGVANPSYFSPVTACPSPMHPGVQCQQPQETLVTETLPAGKASIASREPRLLSVRSTSFFRPKDTLLEIVNPASPDTVFNYQSEREEVDGLADLDNVLRVAFFSADITSIYVGFHSSQTFKMFPYEQLSSYDSEKICDSVMDKPDDVWDNTGVKKPSFYKNVKSSNYNPTCRPWYQRAQRSSPLPAAVKGAPRGDVVFNPIDFDSGTSLPYLSLSSAVWRGSGEQDLVGVVSADLNLAGINQTLSRTDLYGRGYVLVWDDNGMTVVHKSLRAGLPQYDIAWVDATAGGRDEVDEDWMVAQEQGMFAKGRVAGNFNFTYRGEIWYYTFMPVPNTPYMIALSVVYPEVTETADNLAGQLQLLVRNAVIIICVVLGLACACLLWLTEWFNRNVGKPVAQLANYVGQLIETDYAQDLPTEEPGSAELGEISRNMERMLVALRFGSDSKFCRGDKHLELRNCTEALELILDLGNLRGRGACINNMGNCLSSLHELHKKNWKKGVLHEAKEHKTDAGAPRSLKSNQVSPEPSECSSSSQAAEDWVACKASVPWSESGEDIDTVYPKLKPAMQATKQLHAAQPEFQEAFVQFERNPLDPDVYFQLAVIEAQMTQATSQAESNQLARTPSTGSNNSTLAFRLLNHALHKLNCEGENEQGMIMNSACLIEHAARVASAEPATLTTMAWSVCKKLNEKLLEAKYARMVTELKSMCARARAKLAELEGAGSMSVEWADTYAELCGVLCLFDEPEQQVVRAWAALSVLPRMKPELLVSFVWYLKHHKPALVQPIDAALATWSNSMTQDSRCIGIERKTTVWQALSPRSKDVVFCMDISTSMSWPVANGNTRLQECQKAFGQLLDADILRHGDRFGFQWFSHKCGTLMPMTAVSTAALEMLKKKMTGLTARGGTCFFTAIQSSLCDIQAAEGAEEQWIIALTDGETDWQNNNDERNNHSIMKSVLGSQQKQPLNLVCIIVGPNSQAHLIDDLAASCNGSNKVIPLRVGTDDIAAAFVQVQEILSGGGLSEAL